MKKRRGYSVKQGRASSAQSAVGGLFAMVFGIIWTVFAYSMGAPWFFALFGIFFVIMAGVNTYISYKNATGDNRYSQYDIVDINEEPDPWDERFRNSSTDKNLYSENYTNKVENINDSDTAFCPYCGTKAEKGYQYCRKCGKKLPQ